MSVSRRNFIAAALGSLAVSIEAQETRTTDGRSARSQTEALSGAGKITPPILISSANGWNGIDKGYQMLKNGGDTLDAAIAVGKDAGRRSQRQ